jgi:hypothetical protein
LAQIMAPQVWAPSAPAPAVMIDLVTQSAAEAAMDAALFAFG